MKRVFLLLAMAALFCLPAYAQKMKTIALRMLGK